MRARIYSAAGARKIIKPSRTNLAKKLGQEKVASDY
jgi:hypothetical protein